MHAKLLLEAFREAKTRTGSSATIRQARMLSDYILESSKQPYGEKILTIRRKEALGSNPEKVELKQYVVLALSKFLGYQSYTEYLNSYPIEGKDDVLIEAQKERRKRRRIIITISITFIIVVSYAFYHFVSIGTIAKNEEGNTEIRMMIWMNDHYEKVDFDLDKYNYSDLKPYKEDRIQNFRKIQPDCSYEFFDNSGLERLWYGRNQDGDLEFFTDLGRHPITNKTLKRITPYIIKKYICPTYPN